METISDIKETTVPVTGMSCASCAVSVESMLKHTTGVADARVNYANQSVWIEYNTETTTLPELDKVLQGIGYGLIVGENEDDALAEQEKIQNEKYKALQKKTINAGILSVPVVVIGMFFMDLSFGTFPLGNYMMMALTLPMLLVFGKDFFVNAWKQAKHGKANMDTLVALSTGIAFIFSAFNTFYPEFWHRRGVHAHVYFEAAAVIIFFILLGKLMEERAKTSTSAALKKLIGLQPKTVRVIREGMESEIDISLVQTGDEIVIRSGEKIPVDGKVLSGDSFVDESLMTGESMPAEKKTGDPVFAGTLNQNGSFIFKAEKVGKNTVLAQIIKTVREAQGSKAPVQKLVDKIAGIFVPVVIGIAFITFIIWTFFGGENAVTHALLASVSVLVIACPCALGLATPTAIMVGVGKGAQKNILIRDAESLEKARDVNVIILDKTGTLTEGHPKVTDWVWVPGTSNIQEHEAAIRALEQRSEHPLAKAVADYLPKNNVANVEEFQSVTGFGVKGKINETAYVIGTITFLEKEACILNADLGIQAAALRNAAKTVIGVSANGRQIALIAISDQLKHTSVQAVTELKKQGIQVYMLTGDNEQTAAAVAREVGIDSYRWEVKPNDKMEFVKQLQTEGRVVASIAMGKGSDVAMDVAKMTLITSDLMALPQALNLSRKTVATIKQNLFWAFIYNLIGIPLAAGILYPINGFLLDPMIAGGAMALSSVSVVMNSLRLRGADL
jgi:P-type Cu2+ transporter